jgi:hypothetical protein
MIRQSKIAVSFNHPVPGIDLQDKTEFLSSKHWVMAEVMIYSQASAKFVDAEGVLAAEWPTPDIAGITIPVLDEDSPVILEQKSHDYQAVVKQQHPGAWSPWTPNEEQRLLDGVKSGYSYEELSDIHQRTPRAIDDRLFKLGVHTGRYPALGNRPQKRHYQQLGEWKGAAPEDGSSISICLGCGYEVASLPCKCWASKDTSGIRVQRESRFIRSQFGSVIGTRY